MSRFGLIGRPELDGISHQVFEVKQRDRVLLLDLVEQYRRSLLDDRPFRPTEHQRAVVSGSRSGAISGSDADSGISMTLTGLLVNPMLACPRFHSSTEGRKAGKRLFG